MIKLSWVTAHARTIGNEMADRLTKEAARCGGTENVYSRFPKSTL